MGNDDEPGTAHPQDRPQDAAADIERANKPAGVASSGRAGGESAPTQGGERGGPGMGGSSGGAKGMAGAGATAGGPFQSESGQTLKTEEKTTSKRPDKSTAI